MCRKSCDERDGRYYYVRHIPKDLTQHYTIQRLCFSLKTNSDSTAIRYSKSITQRLDDYWFGILLKNMDVPSADKVKLDNVINEETPKISEMLELYLKLRVLGKDKIFIRTDQSASQKEKLGDAFIDNVQLLSKPK